MQWFIFSIFYYLHQFDGNMLDIAEKGLKEMHRVMKKSGIFILITLGNPDMRQPYVEAAVSIFSFKFFNFVRGSLLKCI